MWSNGAVTNVPSITWEVAWGDRKHHLGSWHLRFASGAVNQKWVGLLSLSACTPADDCRVQKKIKNWGSGIWGYERRIREMARNKIAFTQQSTIYSVSELSFYSFFFSALGLPALCLPAGVPCLSIDAMLQISTVVSAHTRANNWKLWGK